MQVLDIYSWCSAIYLTRIHISDNYLRLGVNLREKRKIIQRNSSGSDGCKGSNIGFLFDVLNNFHLFQILCIQRLPSSCF